MDLALTRFVVDHGAEYAPYILHANPDRIEGTVSVSSIRGDCSPLGMGRRVEPAADQRLGDVPASDRRYLVPADLDVPVEWPFDLAGSGRRAVPTAIAGVRAG